MDVERPPRIRPRRRITNEGKSVHVHARAYVMQKARQSRRRPYWSAQTPTRGAVRPPEVNPVTKRRATERSGNWYCSLYKE